MKGLALALTFLVIGGILGVAFSNLASPYFKPRFPDKLGVPPAEATNISPVTASSAAATVAPEPAPVPRAPLTPPPPQVASVPDAPPPAVVPTPPPPAKEAKPAIKQASEKEVRSPSDRKCGGQPIKSITV